jgi:hypothetical protein
MSKRPEDYIPEDVQEAARAAGLSSTPHWYVGRSNGHEHKQLADGLGAVVKKAREQAKLEPPTLVDPEETRD